MKTTKYTKTGISFHSGDLTLEGVLYIPANSQKAAAVTICHPHPQYGGSMDNNVVNSLCESLAEAATVAFKFNFRGVGQSQGEFDNGRGEQLDVKAALDFVALRPEIDVDRIGLAGYSAGSTWGLTAEYNDPRTRALAAISPPVEIFDFSFLRDCQKPVLLISGSRDPLGPPEKIQPLCASNPKYLSCEVVPEADHTWSGYEQILSQRATRFLTANLVK